MDMVRFAETFGNEWNYEINGAWHYRDYLIRAFNQDVPYNQLMREHIAGDLLEKPRINGSEASTNRRSAPRSCGSANSAMTTAFASARFGPTWSTTRSIRLGKAFQGSPWPARAATITSSTHPDRDYYALYGS